MDKKKVIQNKEEEEKKKKAALETKIRKRVAAEEKAYRVVERFVDETVSEDFLKDAGQLITPSHYDDIVVERAIAKLCGYPICKNILTNVSKQKFQISTRTNKVYDITERKKQISDTPVWGRENEPRVQFDLLSLDSKRSMKPWITTNSLKFLKISTNESVDDEKSMGVEARYEELEKQLGIDILVGESAATGPSDHPQNPVPDYAALEKDTDYFSVKVKEYYKGSFTYKSADTEKQDARFVTTNEVIYSRCVFRFTTVSSYIQFGQ
ncbi:hypothetical protein KUTeg_021990 [Tegillarca granosa]|uniref:RNA polymerase II subunit B1 CTD phosphatase RPAP2 homolog n=1 Tax=Tegillarca granosa TaxID=220873 RepID=A0ABQ9E4X6_TEGGR|nr:hypothetical protein KUTeg_021990 [Tegillarca granosa]